MGAVVVEAGGGVFVVDASGVAAIPFTLVDLGVWAIVVVIAATAVADAVGEVRVVADPGGGWASLRCDDEKDRERKHRSVCAYQRGGL